MTVKRKRYLRKSSLAEDRQAKSIPQQESELDQKFGPLPPGAERFTDSQTGRNFDRTGFQALIKACREDPQPKESPGRVEVYAPDRFGRPVTEDNKPDVWAFTGEVLELQQHGWRVEFVTMERSDNQLMDGMQLLMHGHQSSMYSANLSTTVKRGKAHHAREGYWIHGDPPHGTIRYVEGSARVLNEGEEPAGHEAVVLTGRSDVPAGEVEVARVLRAGETAPANANVLLAGIPEVLNQWSGAADDYLNGLSLKRVGERLRDAGITGKRSGKTMGSSSVRNFLSNRALIGEVEYTRTDETGRGYPEIFDARWPPLVDPALWHSVQEELDRRTSKRRRKSQERYPLNPVCAHCGSPYWGSTISTDSSTSVRVYRHASSHSEKHPERYSLMQDYECIRYQIHAEELEEVLRRLIARERGTPGFESQLRKLVLDDSSHRERALRRVKDLKARVSTLEDEEEAAVENMGEAKAAGLSTESFFKRVAEIQRELRVHRSDLREALRAADAERSEWDRMMTAIDETRSIDEFWDTLTLEERSLIYDHWVVAVFIAVERLEDRERGHPRTAIVYLSEAPGDPRLVVLGEESERSISSSTRECDSTSARSSRASEASSELTRPRAHAACSRTSGSGSESAETSEGTASGEPQLPSATQTLRAKPERPARRIAEPREKESHACSSSAVSKRSTSEGEAVPGCQIGGTDGSGSTPAGGSPGPLAAYAGSEDGEENLRLNGQTSWQMSQP